jgi:hypothetical protein
MGNSDLSYCKIFPGIGIARLGNSPDDFFIGPEAAGRQVRPSGGFKDKQGRVKRQAARFRIYGFTDNHQVVGEITSDDAVIDWVVHLANAKAAWNRFIGFPRMQAGQVAAPRNGTELDRGKLVIDPGPKTISGLAVSGPDYGFDTGKFYDRVVPLGELRTDRNGRLMVLGGFGMSGSLPGARPIRSYANNDGWFDDTSDGQITAKVTLKDGKPLEVRGTAHVIVAPPDFAPNTTNLVTLFEVIEEVAIAQGQLPDRTSVSFTRDIYPILKRISGYQWVNAIAIRGHGPGRGGDFLSEETLSLLSRKEGASANARNAILKRLRSPNPANDDNARAQANYFFMPPLSGDGGDTEEGDPTTWLTLLKRQYHALSEWAAGNFIEDWKGIPAEPPRFEDIELQGQPESLNRAALEACVGGAFFPGIEMTFIARDPKMYAEPFRLAPTIKAGDVTKWMALPWQADFYECRVNWWPAQRPDDVVTEEEYNSVVAAFEAESAQGSLAPYLFDRASWSRGIDERFVDKPQEITEPTPREYGQDTDTYKADLEAFRQMLQIQRDVALRTDPEIDVNAITTVRQPSRDQYSSDTTYQKALAQYRSILKRQWDLALRYAGDNQMVALWSQLAFVLPYTAPDGSEVFVEQGRDRYAGLKDRDYFYILLNLDSFPDFLRKAKALADGFLSQAAALLEDPTIPDEMRFFPYSPSAYDARLNEIYNNLVATVEAYRPDDPNVPFKTPEHIIERIRQLSPFNQLDGGWLRNATKAGPLTEIHGLLFEIWSDEVGNGNPRLNHANLYLDLMHSVGLYPEDINTKAYAYDPTLLDSAFTSSVFQLATSQFSELYFPEIMGMTLFLEWEVLELKTTIALFKHFTNPFTNVTFNTQFYEMHVGIDNAVDGHGAKIKRAVEIYLDHVRNESGETALQQHWKRIWNGYIAFKTIGLGEDFTYLLENPPTFEDRLLAMIQRKAPYARLNHGDKRLGNSPINDLFEHPDQLLQALVSANYIVPGDPAASRFFKLLEFTGPMYKVFTEDEIELWQDWTRSLAPGGSGPPAASAGERMVELITRMQVRQEASASHKIMEIKGPDPSASNTIISKPVSWWFEQKAESLMKALIQPENDLIVPGDAGQSKFVTQFIVNNGRMSAAFMERPSSDSSKTWKDIAEEWINAGCPIPGQTQGVVRDVGPAKTRQMSPLQRQVAEESTLREQVERMRDSTRRGPRPPRFKIPRLFLNAASRAVIDAHPARRLLGNGTVH